MDSNWLERDVRIFSNGTLSFAASGLPSRARSKPLASNHSYGYAFSSKGFVWRTCAAPYIRNLIKIQVKEPLIRAMRSAHWCAFQTIRACSQAPGVCRTYDKSTARQGQRSKYPRIMLHSYHYAPHKKPAGRLDARKGRGASPEG